MNCATRFEQAPTSLKILHAVLSYKERLYKERLVEHENHKKRTLVKLGRVKEHPQLSKYAI